MTIEDVANLWESRESSRDEILLVRLRLLPTPNPERILDDRIHCGSAHAVERDHARLDLVSIRALPVSGWILVLRHHREDVPDTCPIRERQLAFTSHKAGRGRHHGGDHIHD